MRGFRLWSLGVICVAGMMSGCVIHHTSFALPTGMKEQQYLNVTYRCAPLFTALGGVAGLFTAVIAVSREYPEAETQEYAAPLLGALGGAIVDWLRCGMYPYETPIIQIGKSASPGSLGTGGMTNSEMLDEVQNHHLTTERDQTLSVLPSRKSQKILIQHH